MRKMLSIAVFALLLGIPATPPAPAGTDPVEVLLGLMDARLQIMVAVAQHKWTRGQPIEDLPREAALLASVSGRASAFGLSPTLAVSFFRAQIEAAKMVQRLLFDRWRAAEQGGFPDAPDLSTSIRPALDDLTPRLLAALAASLPDLPAAPARSRIQAVPEAWQQVPAAWATATAPLLGALPVP